MTLHLLYRGGGFAVHASDRLVTYASRGGGVSGAHDLFGNKTLILLARHGIASIGFTGIAHVGDTPTDEWIAAALWRDELPLGTLSFGAKERSRPHLDLGAYALLLRDALSDRFSKLSAHRRGILAIPITGVSWPPRGAPLSSFDWIISNKPDALDEFSIHWNPSGQPASTIPSSPGPGRVVLRAVPHYPAVLGPDVLAELRETDTIEGINPILARTIQRVSLVEPGVGSDALIVAITPGREPNVTTYFRPGFGQVNSILEGKGDAFPIVFTPWVVGCTAFKHPSVMAGLGFAFTTDGYSLEFETVKSNYGFHFRQSRKQNRSGGSPTEPFLGGLNEDLRRLAPPKE